MASVRIKLKRKGIRELLNSEPMAELVREHGQTVASRSGDGYEAAPVHKTGQRVAVNVYAGTKEAYYDNLENNTLLKAIGMGS